MSKIRHRQIAQQGFTIVEVLIVLAIAGLILLIVFLAIPALSRSSRNNQRNQDVSIILSAISHYELNNSGNIPPQAQIANILNSSSQKLTYYSSSNVSICPLSGPPNSCKAVDLNVSISNTTDVNHVEIYNYAKCEPGTTFPFHGTNAGAGYNDVIALYALESGDPNRPTLKCESLT